MTDSQNKQIDALEKECTGLERLIAEPHFRKIVVTDPIILFPDQWKRLRRLSKEIVAAGEQASIDELWQHAETEGKPVCWTQLAAKPLMGESLASAVQGADGIIACWTTLPDSVLELPGLKYIGYWTNLAAHRVNLDLAKKIGIKSRLCS